MIRKLQFLSALSLIFGFSTVAFAATDNPSGTVTLTFSGISAGVGASIGKGELSYKGYKIPFEASAFSVGEIGIGNKKGRGYIYNLNNLKDFNGTYSAQKAGIAVVAGQGFERLSNDAGVAIELKSEELGVQLGIAVGKTKMTLDSEALEKVLAALNAPAKKTAERSILFDTGSADIADAEKAKLYELVNTVRENPATEVVVTGYTDTQGTFESNVVLSQERAKKVFAELQQIAKKSGLNQLPPERINVFGVGEAGGEQNKAVQANRRVDIAIYSSPRSRKNITQ